MPLGPIFLGGGGDEIDEAAVWRAFLGAVRGETVLYVSAALRRQGRDVLDAAEHWFRRALAAFPEGYGRSVVAASSLNDLDLALFSGVFLGGGDTSILAEALDENGARAQLVEFHKAGRPIYGGSAGAILLGRGSLDGRLQGLNLLNGATCVCHLEEPTPASIYEHVDRRKAVVLGLTEQSGAISLQGRVSSLTKSPVLVFTPDRGPIRLMEGQSLLWGNPTGASPRESSPGVIAPHVDRLSGRLAE